MIKTKPKAPPKSDFYLRDLLMNHYDELEVLINDLASKCPGGEEATLGFGKGRITIKLK